MSDIYRGLYFDEVAVTANVLSETPVETVAAEGLGVADNNEFHASACDGYVHAP